MRYPTTINATITPPLVVVERLALSTAEAGASLGLTRDAFERWAELVALLPVTVDGERRWAVDGIRAALEAAV